MNKELACRKIIHFTNKKEDMKFMKMFKQRKIERAK
jgi:hypothetical protein